MVIEVSIYDHDNTSFDSNTTMRSLYTSENNVIDSDLYYVPSKMLDKTLSNSQRSTAQRIGAVRCFFGSKSGPIVSPNQP